MMAPWLALSLGLWLGQTPDMASSQPADTDIPDPIALQLRDAWARALRNPQQEEDLSQQAPEPGPQVTGLTPSGVGGSGTQPPRTQPRARRPRPPPGAPPAPRGTRARRWSSSAPRTRRCSP